MHVNVGVMLPNWVGDVVMATPALRTLREHLPQARIVGIARPYLLPLLDGTPWLNEIIPWEHHGPGRLVRSWRMVQRLRSERLDLLILLRNSLSAGLAGRLSGAKRIVGYAGRGHRWLLSDAVPPQHRCRRSNPVSAVDEYLHLVDTLGYSSGWLGSSEASPQCTGVDLPSDPTTRKHLELTTRPSDEAAADGVWKRLALPNPDQVMLLNTGGAYGDAKHWPAEYCVSLGLRAAEEFGLTTLVLCGPQERDAAAAIERAAGHPQVRSLAGEDASFGTTKAIIRRSRLMVTTDSGPRHIASAFETPTIVLFGPIDPRWSRNYQRRTIELRVPLDCSPCGQRICPLGHHKCMRDLTVDRVLRAVGQMIDGAGFTSKAA
jgi:lipopolysaccharide heptosyltransferase II